MIWIVLSLVGLVLETALIVALGRRATGSYEAAGDAVVLHGDRAVT